MTFLNGLLAFGATAFTIPLIIHLLHRSRYRTIEWGAMHLLQSAKNLNSRRMQWQQLLLLLIRCSLPVLLALTMSRPFLQSFSAANQQSAISMAIIIDDSMSMFATDQLANSLPKTRFLTACESASEILMKLPIGSNCLVLMGGAQAVPLNGQVPDDVSAKLKDLASRTVPAGDFDLIDSIHESVAWLATSQNPRRQIVVISDFQKHEWSGWNSDQSSELESEFSSQSIPPRLSFVLVSPKREEDKAKHSNLSVDSIDVSPTLIALERELSISTTIGNHGNEKCDNVLVALFVDETEIERQEVSVPPSSTTAVLSRWSPPQSGDHLIRVQILREDNLMPDNNLTIAIVVQEPIPILLVDGDRKGERMKSETDFLRLALSPFSLLTGEKGDVFLSKTIQPNELNEATLANYRVVCLCNVREVNDVQQKAIYDFVERGNGLMVFLGDKVLTEQYQTWPTLAQNGLRIAQYSKRIKTLSESQDLPDLVSIKLPAETALGPNSRIKLQQIDFAPIRELSSVSQTSLASVQFEYRSPIALDPTALSNTSDASVAVRFEDEQAWILESRIGKGRCLWISSSCDDGDSNLPTRSIYVPLMQKLTAYVCNAESPSTQLVAGDRWSRSLVGLASKTDYSANEFQIKKPDGKIVNLPVSSEGQLGFNDTRLLGTYLGKRVPVNASPFVNAQRTDTTTDQLLFCVRSKDWRSTKESNLDYLTADELAKLAISCKASVATNASGFLDSSETDWHGREVWTWIWIALLFLFLAEIALEQRLSPKIRAKTKLATFPVLSRTSK